MSPNLSRGISSDAFAVSDIDNINVFNGNLVLGIPLGISYPVAEGFSYRFLLSYNGRAWDWYDYYDFNTDKYYPQSRPARWPNAGLGWAVNLGRVTTPTAAENLSGRWLYVAPDGAEHTFYDRLHETDPEDAGDPVPCCTTTGVMYTRDGSLLRFKVQLKEIEFPDGQIHKFDAQWRLIQMRDRFSNSVAVTYGNIDPVTLEKFWRISDSQGREHRVYYRDTTYDMPVLIDRVELAAFNGTKATYAFSYNEPITINRACPHVAVIDPTVGATTTVPFLKRLTLPDGSAYDLPLSAYNTGAGTCNTIGWLAELKLPTLGSIAWTFQSYQFPNYPNDQGQEVARTNAAGVRERTLKDAAGAVLGTWIYNPTQYPVGAKSPTELTRTIVTPLGDKTEQFFSAALADGGPEGWLEGDYALPFSRRESNGGRFRSTKTYDCTANPGDPANPTGCSLKRSTWLNYSQDTYVGEFNTGFWPNTNRRVTGQRTVFDDDGGTFSDDAYSDWDGVGHHRAVNQTGTLPGASKVAYTQYNPPGTTPVASTAWLLNTFGFSWKAENGVTAAITQAFSPTTGFVGRRRIHAGLDGGLRTNDVLVEMVGDGQGNVVNERHYGGDRQALTLVDINSIVLPQPPAYTLTHFYDKGVRRRTQHSGMPHWDLDVDIDANTGLVKTLRDIAGLGTNLEYDSSARLVWEKPAQDGWTQLLYTPAASPTVLAKASLTRKSNGGGATLAESRADFDALGRMVKQEERMPDGSWSARTTSYNAMDWKTYVSELGTPGSGTSYLNFDPFGRPATIRPPDGGSHDIVLTYAGIRQTSRRRTVATGATETNATTFETFDRFGRLYEVQEPNSVKTRYTYDVGDRLVTVCQGVSGSTCGQTRNFTYDNRGFLLNEQHPEKGASGNGFVTFSDYDARGHAWRKLDGQNDLRFVFDSGERLTNVNDAGGLALKSWTYGTANAGSDYRLGKVIQSNRFNRPVIASTLYNVTIRELFTYAGDQGRVSQKETRDTFGGSNTEIFKQSYQYDDLGQVSSLTYPDCVFAQCAVSPRTVTFTRTRDRLTAIPGWASSISYHPNGLINQVAHSNGVVFTQANDPANMSRPSNLTSKLGTTTLWTTGTYGYDGSGNIKAIGTQLPRYDSLGRLVHSDGTVPTPAEYQSYTYDNYGNRASVTTNGSLVNEPTSATTNRLSGGTYDAAGNLLTWNGNLYEYDAFSQMKRFVSGAEEWLYMYTANDERYWAFKVGASPRYDLYTLRDLDGRVLREYRNFNWAWSGYEDYVYRDSSLLAGVLSTGEQRHIDLDHLGSVRLVTDAVGGQPKVHRYYPFGREATVIGEADRMKFAGHERDLAGLGGTDPQADDLDYMHARHHSPGTGRFLSVDPVDDSDLRIPQSWNKYAYARNNPLKYTDPTGRSLWSGLWRIFKKTPEGRDILVASIRGRSKEKAIERTKAALNTIDKRQTSQGTRRVVEGQSDRARDAMGKQLSTDGSIIGPEKSGGGYAEHVHPGEGPYRDVHVQTTQAGLVVAGAALLKEIFAPATSAVAETGEATSIELLSAAAWDATSALDPTGLSDAISWYFDIN